ncbi:MAG TPA: Clp protease N-terminal domain-containing protein [Gaiellaceae bacterium]|nr:Clp protease N-terminal domain-containing protein [Gaiellaceae bacterium]
MFERFTERARQVVVLAQHEARTLGHRSVGTEHLLLGLLREEEGLAVRVLADLGVALDETRAEVERLAGRGEEPVETGQIPFTPAAKKALELSLREALALGHNDIGTEHLLLGIVRDGEGVAAEILAARDLDPERIRNAVVQRLGALAGYPGRGGPPFRGRRRHRHSPLTLVVAGWLLGIVALGAGILVGWAIWA